MSDSIPVPGLAPSEEVTPVSSPVPTSRSQMRRQAAQRGEPLPTFTPAAVAPEGAPAFPTGFLQAPWEGRTYRQWRVVKDTEVPRGGSTFFLPMGQVLSEQSYDVDMLRRMGVQLEEITAK